MVRVEPMQLNFPHAKTVIKVWRNSSAAKTNEPEIAYYVSSVEMEKRTPKQWLQFIRNHWAGCEIRNHWRKDACMLEDKTRSRNPNIVATLALIRNLALFFYSQQDTFSTLPGFIEANAADVFRSYRMIKRMF